MTGELALLLGQDGVANGAIYALVALGIVLVFQVTRVVFVPFGDLLAWASLTLASLQRGERPGIFLLVGVLAVLAGVSEVAALLLAGRGRAIPRALLVYCALPLLPVGAALLVQGQALGDVAAIGLTVALVLPLGPLLYRIAFQPIADGSVLVLLMVAVVLHFALSGVALMAFGPEGARPAPMISAVVELGGLVFTGQSLAMMGAAGVAALGLFGFFAFTLTGRALRAVAVNRLGARLVGIAPTRAAGVAFLWASGLAAISGVLIGPGTTLFYDSGFVIGLKAFVGAIIGGLVSFPGAVAGAVLVGVLESFAGFWDSAIKEMVVFASLVPVLILRSLFSRNGVEEEAP
jgi:branched-chain amino acid transport system permease protein